MSKLQILIHESFKYGPNLEKIGSNLRLELFTPRLRAYLLKVATSMIFSFAINLYRTNISPLAYVKFLTNIGENNFRKAFKVTVFIILYRT